MTTTAVYDYDDEHKRFGYGRIQEFEDMQQGFVFHERHIFLCYGNRRSWPGDFVLGDPDSLPARLTCALKSCEDEISRKTILTICEPSGDVRLKEGDVLIFPDMIKYRLNPSGVDSFIKEVIVNNQIWSGSPMKPLRKGSYVFVCAHGAHDRRSGVCGQLVLEKLNEVVALSGLQEKLFPIPCSDIGMPEFAANLIVFARDGKNEIDAHWYAHVSPKEAPGLLYSHLVAGQVTWCRWRGKMGIKRMLKSYQYPSWWWERGSDGSIGSADCQEVFHKMDGCDWDIPRRYPVFVLLERPPRVSICTPERIEDCVKSEFMLECEKIIGMLRASRIRSCPKASACVNMYSEMN